MNNRNIILNMIFLILYEHETRSFMLYIHFLNMYCDKSQGIELHKYKNDYVFLFLVTRSGSRQKAIIQYIRVLKDDLAIFRLVPVVGQIPDYHAGQFLIIGFTHPKREQHDNQEGYSIASHPENKKYFELVIRWVKKPVPGRLTTQLFDAKVGDEINWLKPTGIALSINEKLPNGEKDNRRNCLYWWRNRVAPFVSFARHLHAVGDKREIVMMHGAS